MRILFLSVCLIALGVAWSIMPSTSIKTADRIYGASLVNPPQPIESATMSSVKRVNAEWVAVIPYGFSRAGQASVSFDHARQWWGERTSGNCMLMRYAKEHDLKIMVKPHVWVMGQGWTGDFDLSSEEEWKIWEEDYARYIVNHAIKADSMGAALFCIGTEFRTPSVERPHFWRKLAGEVRKVYSGKVTYAANWDNYEKITWWDEVDYIGIDAYFPLVEGSHPSIAEIKSGWEPVKKKLANFSEKWDKQILFTEYGFQSANGAAWNHWEIDESPDQANPQLQADAYEATFQALGSESWWAGGFFWKWHFTIRTGDWYKTQWTPQNKPAERVIAKWYGKNN